MRRRPPLKRRAAVQIQRPEPTEIDIAALAFLKRNGPAKAPDIQTRVGANIANIVTSLRRLDTLGFIEKIPAGTSILIAITTSGREYVTQIKSD